MGKIASLIGEKKEQKNENEIDKIIQDLKDTPSSDSNDDQGKFVQLLKGVAFSDDPKSDAFMKKLMDMVNDKNFGGEAKKDEGKITEDKAYYQSELKGLGKAKWPDVTVKVYNGGNSTKFLTVTPEFVKEFSAWVKKMKIKKDEE